MFSIMNKKSPLTVLNFLIQQKDELHTRDIARKTGLSLGFVSRILNELTKQELILLTRKGRMKFYRSNSAHPLIKQLKVLLTIYFIMPLIKSLGPITRRMILFGSCARGENSPDSDIDLFVLTSNAQEVRKKIFRYQKVMPIIMTSEEFLNLQNKDISLYEQIMHGITLWESNE